MTRRPGVPRRPDRRLLRRPTGRPKYPDIGLSVLRRPGPTIDWVKFAEHRPRIGPDQSPGVNGVIVLTPAVTAETVSRADDLLAIGRFGVGYDAVDVAACTAADVAVFITAGAVDRSVAEATVGWMIALTHHVRTKDALVRDGPVGRPLEVHGPRAARPDLRRDRPRRDRPGDRRPAPRASA